MPETATTRYLEFFSVGDESPVHLAQEPAPPNVALCGKPVGSRNGSDFSVSFTGVLMCTECCTRAMEMQVAELRENGRVDMALWGPA
jgi:hypothetical protein